LSAVQFVGVPPQQNPDASAIINLMRNLGGSVGVSVVTTALQWRGQFHHVRLGEHVTPYDGFTTNLGAIAAAVQRQASILSYLDVFTMLSLVALATFPLALFLPNLPKGKPAGGH
jgi:DHA2 family multidrug resistance protein